jgi:hypothetical protein
MLNELTPAQRDLAEYMSHLSECAYSAAWMDGLELALWQAVVKGPYKYGRLQLEIEHVQRLILLSERCDGWIQFHGSREESFITLAEWKQLVSS